jgi:predicted small metal-binding protein
MFAGKELRCECGYEVRASDEEALVEEIRHHASEAHGIAFSVDLARELARGATQLPGDTNLEDEEVPMRTIVCLVLALSALAGVATTANAGSASSCRTNRTFDAAARNGALPAIYAAVHGGAGSNVSSNCSLRTP